MEKPKKRKKYYIQPEDLRVEIAAYQAQQKVNPETAEATERLGEMLLQIATGLAASSRFDRWPCRDDMTGDAVVRMYKNLHLIDLDHPKCNPFSYLTMICYRVYISRTFKENKIRAALDDYREEVYSEFECAECISNRNPSEGDMDLGFDEHAVEEPSGD